TLPETLDEFVSGEDVHVLDALVLDHSTEGVERHLGEFLCRVRQELLSSSLDALPCSFPSDIDAGTEDFARCSVESLFTDTPGRLTESRVETEEGCDSLFGRLRDSGSGCSTCSAAGESACWTSDRA